MSNNARIRAFLKKLNFSNEVIEIYLALQLYGPQQIAELSRNSGVERSRLYRIIDTLKNSNLVEIEMQYKRQIFQAVPVDSLHLLVIKKKQELKDLQKDFSEIKCHLKNKQQQSDTIKVQVYTGADGLRQIMWNQTRSKTECLSLLHDNIQNRTDTTFFKRWAERINGQGIQTKSLINDHFIAMQKEWYATHANKRIEDWSARYLPKEVLTITYNTIVYNNVVAHYHWEGDKLFGIEIYSSKMADSQRQIFELLWRQSQLVDDLSGPLT